MVVPRDHEVGEVHAYDALRYLAGRPSAARAGGFATAAARRALAELGIGEPHGLVRMKPIKDRWSVRATQTIESDVARLEAWSGSVVSLTSEEVRTMGDSSGRFARAMGSAGLREPVPVVAWGDSLAGLAASDSLVRRHLSWSVWGKLTLLSRERSTRDVGLVVPEASDSGLDPGSFLILLGSLYEWTSADLPYVAHGLVDVANRALGIGGRPLVEAMGRMWTLALMAGAQRCATDLEAWIIAHAPQVGLAPPSGDEWHPISRLMHSTQLGDDATREVLERYPVDDPRDVIPALEVAIESGRVTEGLIIVRRLLKRTQPSVAQRSRGGNVDDFVELCGMLFDMNGEHDMADRCFRSALEMPTIVDAPFRRWWLQQRLARGPRFFLQRRWRVVGRDRDYRI